MVNDFGAGLRAEQDKADAEENRISSAREALPDESQCDVCEWFDLEHVDVRRVLYARDPSGRLYGMAGCKCQEREDAALAKLLKQANLPLNSHRDFDSFIQRDGTEPLYRAARNFVDGHGPPILVMVGGTGVGKSHLMESAIRYLVRNKHKARYELAPNFLDRLRHTFSGRSESDLYELTAWYQAFEILAMDDVGMEKGTDFAGAELTRLLDIRIQAQRRTIVSTNLNKAQMAQHLGDRLASRLYETNPNLGTVKLVECYVSDYRSFNAQNNIPLSTSS
ncbi:MAG: ATP-binding protein [Desulfobacterales bacterium]|nr:ATP-binding protein [Desulfobacterales bacterium]